MAWFASLFGSNVASGSSGASAIDAVTYLASLASNPREIDTILDDLRQVTAQMTANRPLSDQEQAKLAVVYSKLIDYLVQKESLRKFTREGLSAKVHAHFKQDAASAVFWQKITT